MNDQTFVIKMKRLFRNPLTVWFAESVRALFLEYHYRKKHLKIGYMASVRGSTFGAYNTLYGFVTLRDVSLGDFTYIAKGTSINQTDIGKFCSIGSNCTIGLGRHPSSVFVSTHPIFYSTLLQSQITFADKNYYEEYRRITIGNDVWVGNNVLVADGVKIGNGAIVAAGAVVTKNIPPYAIVGGVPAKIIKYRFQEDEIEVLNRLKWWDMDIGYLKMNFRKFHNINTLLSDFQ